MSNQGHEKSLASREIFCFLHYTSGTALGQHPPHSHKEIDTALPSTKPAPIRAGCPPQEQWKALMGAWEVKYPGPDDMIQDDYSERLELKGDGTFSWNPAPAWAPKTGTWLVEQTHDNVLRLGFEDKWGHVRWNYLVLIQMKKGGPLFLNWQSTRGDVVIFADRIFRADRPNRRERWHS